MSGKSRSAYGRVKVHKTYGPAIAQTQPLPGMIPNSAGGFTFQVSDMNRLRRFLCLGSEKGTYYVSEQKLTLDNAKVILRLIQSEDAIKALDEIENFSTEGRCAKQQALLFCYAMCARFGSVEVRRQAYAALPRICRIPTHLFMFIGYCETLGDTTGWGRLHRRAVQNWYNNQDPMKLAFAVTKYAQREGWSHRDILRLCHAKPEDPCHDLIYKYITKGWEAIQQTQAQEAQAQASAEVAIAVPAAEEAPMADHVSIAIPMETEAGNESAAVAVVQKQQVFDMLCAVETLKKLNAEDEWTAIGLISKYKLAREHLPTAMLSSRPIWEALLQDMQPTALMRNLNKMTSLGLFEAKNNLSLVVDRLTNVDALKRAKIHPFNVLVSWKAYQSGHGLKGKLNWVAVPAICKALEAAFYKSFVNVVPTGKRFVLALDVSGSMTAGCVLGAEGITPRDGSAAMAMVIARTEPKCRFMAFSNTFIPLSIKPDMSMDQVLRVMDGLPFSSTDCALPMTWALSNRVEADVFMVFTDNETFYGKIHPCQALQQYREKMKIPAKLIVVGMTATGFTIADPEDSGMLDMCGFDSAAPEIVRQFVMGDI